MPTMSPQRYPRSPKVLLGGMASLARFLDKIRLRRAGHIRDYNYITVGFDKHLLDFLQIKATVLNVKRTEWPHHARRQPCGYRLTIWPGFLILGPILAMRAQWPTQLFGLVQNMDVTTKLFYGLTGPRGQRSITSKLPSDHIVNEHRTKIQGEEWVDIIELDEGRL
ncbi:MAG: DUF5069 domain-containing protein [Nitrospirae bacterium]|nr:MAG: DUF5069 domain-containing protein [Nitrospirota bacterium]